MPELLRRGNAAREKGNMMSDPVYTFAYVQVSDHGDYQKRYAQFIPEIIAKFGGKFLAATTRAGVVEGELAGNWAVLAEFPSMESAQAFYSSEEYAPYLKLRREELSTGSTMVTFEGGVPTSLG